MRTYLLRCGGIRPDPRRRSPGRLSFAEREEISRGLAAGQVVAGDRSRLGRAASTVSREVAANGGRDAIPSRDARTSRRGRGRRVPRRASWRPTRRWLRIVAEKLRRRWSPQQIAGWLKVTYPDDPEMQVSHESIYRTLFVQSRGALRKELTAYLRTGRVIRRPQGVRLPDGRGGRPGILNISERPAEAEDRAVPGHWEGDLVFGKHMSPVATLVERSTRFLMLVALPGGNHKADAVADALAAAVTTLPSPAGPVADLGPGPRDGRSTRRFTTATGIAGLLLRPQVALAARQQREHQRPAAPVPAPTTRLPHPDPGRLRRHRPRAQRTPSTDPRLQDTITSTSRGVALTA